jgi:hypothetical protein
VQPTNGEQEGSEERRPRADQTTSYEVEHRDTESTKCGREQPETKLIQREERVDQIVVEEIHQRPGVRGLYPERIP